jgi:homoserine dehydrogenase
MTKTLKIGLFGFGCVGQGLYHVLSNSTGFTADIVKIAVKHRNKERPVAADRITYDKHQILDDPEIDVVVELIDDAEEAFQIVSEALKRGKHVVTANKKLLALHLEALIGLQLKYGGSLLYEGAVCGSIPILRTLEEYFDNEELDRISGIFNGTTNYILTKTIHEGLSYTEALRQAQENGFAESDPSADVEGFDPKYKTVILLLHAFGLIVKPAQVLNLGITSLSDEDIRYATEKGYQIRLAPVIRRIGPGEVTAFVLPRFVKPDNQLFHVYNEFNGVIVEGRFSGEQFLQGRGAGSHPTGAAVLSDISALSHGYKYAFKKYTQGREIRFSDQVLLHVYLRYQKPGDISQIPFAEVTEQYTGRDYHYTIGLVDLRTLVAQQSYLVQNRIFVSLVSDQVKTAGTSVLSEKEVQFI